MKCYISGTLGQGLGKSLDTKRLQVRTRRRFALWARMPSLPPKPCVHPGCGKLVTDGSGRCAQHPKKAWVSAKPTQRLRGRAGQQRRREWLTMNPHCAHCLEAGQHRLGSIVDHVIPLAEGGADDCTNLQTLCTDHDKIKTQAEAKRGRGRWVETS